mmetsp:Transcript_17672/g.40552  ORF Transcript_17672/g.40552 Transcript_17672/m.40552 type:complete len:128 (+) Transcript_17672:182-565(+)|eukprot:CAMPEP_0172374768 /NCGR_PEP_ID=MMETSP1060-20121228/57503_1 /TAXON_ID=37318 /ORGANISM="Pseudo-nitzschia pungens, Strain cf. cingulata" /LENGTH=127 /DNA_ID=CAMNT_0013101575 /DNA_START=63 /DNA_END=446 /DNA_ORIENTATION=-
MTTETNEESPILGDNAHATTPAANSAITHRIHACEIEVTFPTNLQADQALRILQVDREPTDRVSKSFRLIKPEESGEDGEKEGNEPIYKLQVRFESKELKMIRVAVSSFYDYLVVVLKTLQEFDTTI